VAQFGEELRRERLSRGIELETISGTTKVVTRYLKALENDHFEVLPGGILSKGIVRSYARAVGLDEGAWVDRFLAASKPAESQPDDNGWTEFASNVGKARARNYVRPEMRLRWAGVALLLVVLVGLGWFVYRYVSGRVVAGELQHPGVTSASLAPPGTVAGQ
jgi:cytoskeleton protein RodZ